MGARQSAAPFGPECWVQDRHNWEHDTTTCLGPCGSNSSRFAFTSLDAVPSAPRLHPARKPPSPSSQDDVCAGMVARPAQRTKSRKTTRWKLHDNFLRRRLVCQHCFLRLDNRPMHYAPRAFSRQNINRLAAGTGA